jgi:hypothetical protein
MVVKRSVAGLRAGPPRAPQQTVDSFKRNRTHIIGAVQAVFDALDVDRQLDVEPTCELALTDGDFRALR